MNEFVNTVTLPDITCGSLVIAKPNAPKQLLKAFHIDLDVDQPDMCLLTVDNTEGASNKIKLGDPLEVKVGDTSFIFKGEVVALEPIFRATGASGSTLLIRGYSLLHRLLRGRYSETWPEAFDSDIVKKVAAKSCNRLTVTSTSVEATKVKHDHVYQHNQTDLEFLRILAARNGHEIVVEDKTLYFRKPIIAPSKVTLELRRGAQVTDSTPKGVFRIKQFHARLSSAGLVNEVEVRGWDPEKKKEIVARVKATADGLGGELGTSAAAEFGQTVTYTVDRPIANAPEAEILAKARMRELLMGYITGDVHCHCREKERLADLKAGMILEIVIEPGKPDKFSGMYKVMGVSHRYSPAVKGLDDGGGYDVVVRVRRDAEGK